MIDNEPTRFNYLNGYAVETSLLISMLKTGKPGDERSDAELTKLIGRDTGTKGSGNGNLLSAIRYCIRCEGVMWERIRKANKIRCLDDSEKLLSTDGAEGRVRRISRRSMYVLGIVEREKLLGEEQKHFDARISQMRTVALIASPSLRKKLEAKESGIAAVDKDKLLALF